MERLSLICTWNHPNATEGYTNTLIMEQIVTRSSCTSVLLCGDFNTSFDRQNAQTNFLSQYMERLSLICTWNHPNATEGYTNTLTMT